MSKPSSIETDDNDGMDDIFVPETPESRSDDEISVDSSVSANNRGSRMELYVPDSDECSESGTTSSTRYNGLDDDLHVSESSCACSTNDVHDWDEMSQSDVESLHSNAASIFVPESTTRSSESSRSLDMRSSHEDDRDGINGDAESTHVPGSPDRSSSVDMADSNDDSRENPFSVNLNAPSAYVSESTTRSSDSPGSNGHERVVDTNDNKNEGMRLSFENLPLDEQQENEDNANNTACVNENHDSDIVAAGVDQLDGDYYDNILLPLTFLAENESAQIIRPALSLEAKPATKRCDDDQTFCSIVSTDVVLTDETKAIVYRIEELLLRILRDLDSGKKMHITVQNHTDWSNCLFEDERLNMPELSKSKCSIIRSPFKLSVIFYVLNEVHALLLRNKTCTVREIYYKDVKITQKQENVNDALRTICCLLNAAPWQLGVLSSSKGLMAGNVKIQLPDSPLIDYSVHKDGTTLPQLTSRIVNIETSAKFVLVVEKDTVFQKILQFGIIERFNGDCIVLTGKGYPDINTRLMLCKIFALHALPIYIITDADPFGIEIMLTYRHGSLRMSNLSKSLALPSARWIGIFPSDIKMFGMKSMPLADEDKHRLEKLLTRPYTSDVVYRELLEMNRINAKAEIEGLADSSCAYLIDVYLRNKIDNKHFV